MKTVYSNTKIFYLWAAKVFPIQKQGCIYYKFSISGRSGTGNQYDTQQIYPTEEAACQVAYFCCLRASLDREPDPALIVDRESGYILSINLPAFDLFKMNAVGLKAIDLTRDLESERQIHQELQATGEGSRKIYFQNADGQKIECKTNTRIVPHYSGWMIVRLTASNAKASCL